MNLAAWRRYFRLYKGSYASLSFSVLLSAGQTALLIPVAYLVKYIFDQAIPTGNFNRLMLAGALIGLVTIASSGLSLWVRWLTLRITKTVHMRMRSILLERCYTFSRSHYSYADFGLWQAVIIQDSERVDSMGSALVVQLFPALLASLALMAVLLYLNSFLFLVLVSLIPAFLWVEEVMKKKIRSAMQAFRESYKSYNKGVIFVLQMLDFTHAYSAEAFELSQQHQNIEELRQTGTALAWSNLAYSELQAILVTLAGVLILVVGGMWVARGRTTIGALMSFYVAVGMLSNYLRTVWAALPAIIAGNQSLIVLHAWLDVDDNPPYRGSKKVNFQGGINLENVSFAYKDAKVLEQVNLNILPHSRVAILGPNGAGKTTLVHLILGFYRPDQGRLLAGSSIYDELDIQSLRQDFGVVMQNPILFPGTILENLTYGFPDASLQEVEAACELATAREFIELLPEGYQTFVGEQGVLLSGGQRQRLALARAMIRRPRLLILDEPTNHLDEDSVQQFMHNLSGLDYAPTILLITHDIDLAKYAQVIYAFENGRLRQVDQGQLAGHSSEAFFTA